MILRDDWIEKALDVLTAQGIHAVQITTLAKAFGVTRGGFYWHFKSREDLLDAILAEWRARNGGVFEEVLSQTQSLETGILDLFSIWLGNKRFDVQLDQAVREWTRSSLDVEEMVRAEDDERIAQIATFFERHGYADPEAFIRARVIYFTQLSYYALKVEESMAQRMNYLDAYFQCFTGKEISAATAEEFRRRLLQEQKDDSP